MTSMNGISAYQQVSSNWKETNTGMSRTNGTASPHTNQTISEKESAAGNVDTRSWAPVNASSFLIPRQTEYGNTIGDVQLSDKAKAYYDKLKSKFHNMEFIAVSKDMKAQVQQNATSYGNANKMVVLIDDEKIERMATDESFRKKYEGIIAMSQNKMAAAKNSLTSSGASVKNFGMSVDSDGKESFFATVGKSQDIQKKRIEKKAAEKKEQKIRDKKKAEKKERDERIRKAKDRYGENATVSDEETEVLEKAEGFVTIEADSMDELLSKVQDFSYNSISSRVKADVERVLGTKVDFRG